MKKIRIVRRYSPLCGEWFAIQRKFLFWWITYPHCFEAYEYARNVIENGDVEDLDNKICEIVEKKYY